jgi:uncharacterized membrane protein
MSRQTARARSGSSRTSLYAWFFLTWAGYNLTVDRLLRRPHGLNQHMRIVRQSWMNAMLDRDERVIDALLIGHLIHSVSFFASATMLLIAALIGTLAAFDQAYGAVMGLSLTVKTSQQLFELKLLLLIGVFVYAFFKFTWALRQYNYVCALLGAMAPRANPAPTASSEAAGRVRSRTVDAVRAFNQTATGG